MTKASDNEFPSLLIKEGTAPSSPAAGDQRLFVDSSDHLLKLKNSSGTVSGIGGMANPMTTSQDIIVGGSSGTPGRLAKGADGTFLGVVSGSLAYATPAGGGGGSGDVLLERHSASASATLDFTTRNASGQSGALFQSDFNGYRIDFDNVIPATNNQAFVMRMGTGGGPTWDTGTNYGYYEGIFRVGGAFSTTGAASGLTSSQLVGLNVGVSSNTLWGICGSIRLFKPLSTSLNKSWLGELTWFYDTGADPVLSISRGVYISTTALTGIRFLFASGNIASGDISVFGVNKT